MEVDPSTLDPIQVIFFVVPEWIRKTLNVSPEVQKGGAMFIAQEESPRDYFLFSVLETLQRVGYTIVMLQRHLKNADLDEVERDLNSSASVADTVTAGAFLDYFIRSELVCMRQLVELFVDVLGFSDTNEQPYYEHYMLVEALDQARRVDRDWRTFYDCQNAMMATVVESLEKQRDRAAAECDGSRCWFSGKTGRPTSVAFRYKKAMLLASTAERVSLGFSYNLSYGQGSRAVHIGIGAIQSKPVGVSAIDGYQRFVERLGLLILSRAIELAELRDTPDDHRDVINVLLQLSRYSTEGNHPDFALTVEVGDLVATHADLGVVEQVHESAFGNRSCRVLSVAEGAGQKGDWWPVVTLKPLRTADELAHALRTSRPELQEPLSPTERIGLGLAYGRLLLDEARDNVAPESRRGES